MHPILLRNHHFRRGRLAQAIRYGFTNILGIDTLFTDTNGAVPVENLGDAIALATNLVPDGPSMVQVTAARRPIFGRMPSSGIKNYLATADIPSERYSFPAWNKLGTDVVNGADGILFKVAETSGGGWHVVKTNSNFRVVEGKTYTTFFIAKQAEFGWIQFAHYSPGFSGLTSWRNFDVANGVVGNGGTPVHDIQPVPPELYAEYPELEGAYICMAQAVSNAAAGNAGIQFYLTGNLDAATSGSGYEAEGANGIYLTRVMLAEGARDIDWYIANYQKITSAYDITEAGVASTDIAYLGYSKDEAFSWTLDAGPYYLFVAGERGCFFDSAMHSGGEFTVGPLDWSGTSFTQTDTYSPLTRLIGRRHVIMPELRVAPFNESDKGQLVFDVMARGCPGVWVESEELFVPPFTVSGGGALIDHGDGSYTHTPGTTSTLVLQAEATFGEQFIVQLTVTNYVAGNVSFYVANTINQLSGRVTGNTAVRRVVRADKAGQIRLVFGSTFDGTVSNISLKRLTLETPPAPEPESEESPPIPPEELEYDGYYTLTLTTKFLQVPTLDENYPPAENKIWGIGTHTEPEITIISTDGVIPGTLTKAGKILTDNIFNEPGVDSPIHHFDFSWMILHLPGAGYARSIAIRQTAESSTLGVTIVGIQANDDYITEDNTDNWFDYFGDPYAGYDTFHVEGLTFFDLGNLPEKLSEPDEPITVRVYYKNE